VSTPAGFERFGPPPNGPPTVQTSIPPASDTLGGGGTRPSLALIGLAAVLALGILGSAGWRLSGGSLYVISTPSMCPTMCVGTLAADRPASGPIKVGQVVTFRPPGTTVVFTHRVTKVLADGSLKTQGDAEHRTDPWTVPRANVIGVVAFSVRGLGWFWRALPAMALGLVAVLVVRRQLKPANRRPWDLLFVTLLIVVPLMVMRPLLLASVIGWQRAGHDRIVVSVANVGLLPAQFDATGGATVGHVAPGGLASITAHLSATGHASVHQSISLFWWQWCLAALVVIAPMVIWVISLLWSPSQRHTTNEHQHPGNPTPIPG
jgi:signal peptidase I